MARSLFVGGIPFSATRADLEKLFSACGKVTDVKIPMDRETGRPKGIAFVEMETDEQAAAALRELNGAQLGGRRLFVNEARPQEKPQAASRPAANVVYGSGPGMIDRRKGGGDRRKDPHGSATGPAPEAKPRWESKPRWEKKPWGDKKPFGEKKPWGKKPFGEKKPWEKKPFGEKKPWEKKPFGEKKPWEKKPFGERKPFSGEGKPGFGAPKKWGDKPDWSKKPKPGGAPRKKWGPAGPNPGQKPGQFKRSKPFRRPR